MRFLKRQTINRRQLKSTTVYSDVTDANVYINPKNSGSMVLPSGTDAQIPGTPVDGMMRYNAEHGEVQVRQSGQWRSLRFKEPVGIGLQNLGAGDGTNLYFGPLTDAAIPSVAQSGVSWDLVQKAKNLLVIVENVIQVAITNYTVVQNPSIPGEVYSGRTSAAANVGSSVLYFNTSLNGTGASGDNTTVTLTFATQPAAPFAVGSSIVVTGFTPVGYNGTYTVTACTTGAVSFLSSEAGVMTVAGNITSTNAVYPSVDITGATVTGSASLQANTTILSYSVDSVTNALTSITLSKTLITATINANTALTITDLTNSGSGYFLKFGSPVPYGKTVTMLHGFDR